VDQLSTESQDIPLVIFRAQVHLPCFRYHLREGSRPFRMHVKNHGIPRKIKDTWRSQETFRISYGAALAPSFRDPFRRLDFLSTLLSSRARRPSNRGYLQIPRLWRIVTARRRAGKRFELSRVMWDRLWGGVRNGSIGWINERIPASDLSRENARHECGTLWCVRGTVVCTLNSVGTPHPHSVAVGRVPLCATSCTCTHTTTWHVGVLRHEGEQAELVGTGRRIGTGM